MGPKVRLINFFLLNQEKLILVDPITPIKMSNSLLEERTTSMITGFKVVSITQKFALIVGLDILF